MQFSAFFTALVMAAAAHNVAGATVQFSGETGCRSFSNTYQGSCNFCADPPGDFASVLFSGIGSSNRVTIHNQNGCTSASQVGQGYGGACWNKGGTAIRSAWVACPGARAM
ncbi:asparaginase [Mycena polygramma]|nr:asparaginase [Mycena polygramma]